MKETLLELIRRTSAFLPPDVEEVLRLRGAARQGEALEKMAMEAILHNIGLAKQRSLPICQDTGTIAFYVHHPVGFDSLAFRRAAEEAVVEATRKGYLRQNSVIPIEERNTGNNLGAGHPVFHFEAWDKPHVEVRLILKGGGCENMSTQYKLPAIIQGKRADRDLKGIKACILDAVHQAQGKGCGPGFLGVCIGGDRAESYRFAKEQLLRPLDDTNPDETLAQLEEEILREANTLNIGPMGFSGKLTLGGCKIGKLNRLPASYFVSIAYMCWAYRRRGVVMTPEGEVLDWLYQQPHEFEQPPEVLPFEPPEEAIRLHLPATEEEIRKLKVGDTVLLSGSLITGRDAVHKYLFKGGDLDILKGQVIYHCGPVILEKDEKYEVMAAGPTTSIREEPYQGDLIRRFQWRGVIGKGGMGKNTLKALKEVGAVYFHAIGGAAQLYALCIQEVKGVYLKEKFGSPEAIWHFEVKDFPVVVTMDSYGNSLHEKVEKASEEQLKKLLA